MRVFEKQRYRANQNCPCGKSNRDGKFATEKGFVGRPVGYCHSCTKSYSNDKSTIVDIPSIKKFESVNYCNPTWENLESTFDINLNSNFAKYLIKTFGEERAIKAVEKYYLGNHLGKVIFWQLDRDNNLRAGKIVNYNDKGKRYDNFQWYHIIKNQDCQINQCFFGDHLIPNYDLPIAVVEGAKGAIIMSILRPDYIWISAESKSGLSINKCESIIDYDVTLYPDHDAYEEWNKTAQKYGFEISRDSEIWFEKGLIKDGEAIDDYYLRNHTEYLKPKIRKYDPKWNQKEYDQIFNLQHKNQ